LGDAPIHEQLDSRDVSCCQSKPGTPRPGDLVGSTEATERHRGGNRRSRAAACREEASSSLSPGVVDGPRAHRVHPDVAILQVGRPRRANERTGGLGALYTLLAANPLLPTIDR